MNLTSSDPFITYQGSSNQAMHDMDHLKKAQKLLDPSFWRHPAAKAIKGLLHDHVKSKKGLETIFVQDLAYMYSLTRLLTAIGFPADEDLAHKAFLGFNAARSHLRLLRPYRHDTYLTSMFPHPPSSPQSPSSSSSPASDQASIDKAARWRNLSMLLGVFMGILKEYDGWIEQIRKRMAVNVEASVVLTTEEEKKLQNTYQDVYCISKELLGGLAGDIDAAIEARE